MKQGTRSQRCGIGRVAALLLVTVSQARAGQVWSVDDDGGADFTSVSSAVAAAADGDVLLVREGAYSNVVIDGKALTIVADDTPAPGGHELFSVKVRNLAAGKSVAIRGFTIDRYIFDTQAASAVVLQNNSGTVLLEDCEVLPQFSSGGPVLVSACDAVFLTRCDVTGGDGVFILFATPTPPQRAITASDSNLYLYESVARGGNALPAVATSPFGPAVPGYGGAEAVRMQGGRLLVSGSVLEGGKGGDNVVDGAVCVGAGAGGPAIRLTSGAQLVRIDSALDGGPGGSPSGICPGGAAGAGVDAPPGSVQTIPDTARSIEVSAIVREGQNATITFHGAPGEPAEILFALDTSGLWVPGLNGALYPGLPLVLLITANLSASGDLQLAVTIPPSLPAAVGGLPVHVQSLAIAQSGLGILGSPTVLTVVQAGL